MCKYESIMVKQQTHCKCYLFVLGRRWHCWWSFLSSTHAAHRYKQKGKSNELQ